MKKFKDLDYNVDSINFHNRKLVLCGDIEEKIAYKIISKLFALNSIDPDKPIELTINTCGGNCNDGMAIAEAIIQIDAPVHTIIMGEADSMGAIISIVGTKRSATRNSIWMTHDMQIYLEDSLKKVKDRVKFLKKYDQMFTNLFTLRTKLTKKEINRAKIGELWLFADEMLKKGVIDEII